MSELGHACAGECTQTGSFVRSVYTVLDIAKYLDDAYSGYGSSLID